MKIHIRVKSGWGDIVNKLGGTIFSLVGVF